MDTARLVSMANDIAAFFDAEAGRAEEAAEGVKQHLVKFWAPRMRQRIREHLAAGGVGLAPTARAAVSLLEQ